MVLRQATFQFLRRIRPSSSYTSRQITGNALPNSLSNKLKFSCKLDRGSNTRRKNCWNPSLWIVLAGQAATIIGVNANFAIAEDASIESGSENHSEGANSGLRKIEDGSIISNSHTSKWRIFTDNGREFFLQGKLEQAEQFFSSALQEAKEGFGEKDPHVASACNNLAELYRVKKEFEKAEPLYLEAINILEESFGPEDIRVGAAFHNLGQFYLMQRKLEKALLCYERALKIKGRVLGHAHHDYAETMYHLGTVLHLQGRDKNAEALILDSIQILEEGGEGYSTLCIKRMRYLAQIYLKSNRLAEAENVQRKILHIMEISKGWDSLDTVIAAERQALTLEAIGNLDEAQELLERCLHARKSLLPEDHIQIGGNMLHIARVVMLKANKLSKMQTSEAIAELDKANDLLYNAYRIAWQVLNKVAKQKGNGQIYGAPGEARRDGHAALVILLQSLDTLGLVEINKQELKAPVEKHSTGNEAENALLNCISAYKEFANQRLISDHPDVKAQYLSCLKRLSSLINNGVRQSRKHTLQELKDEIQRVEGEVSSQRKKKQ
ncbi:RNA polymerase-associated protein CTR9 [Tripterygium wilfordii]|uniref:RNA polymerase-associated protein CTR9 n=1 Tax=Tripterygium wilfordii TaxID=458696 RepID=A0A7J7DMC5_TRIWF|nr:uncharacterized protein LOC119998184 [Tripterygium wilfordii]KAF5747478.1 RNA polymerase-associated protein CTR9 [Tripterygium wilfordii]